MKECIPTPISSPLEVHKLFVIFVCLLSCHNFIIHYIIENLRPVISHLKQTVMSKNKVNAKREAYAKKQEEQGRKVVAWIFGALIVLAIAYMIWTFSMMA